MAESIVVVYGGKRMPVTPGTAEKDVKALMARFFPELADPKIEKKKDGDTMVWTFSKKAGTKGGRQQAAAVQALLALEAQPLIPADVVKAVQTRRPIKLDADAFSRALQAEAELVAQARQALLDLAPARGLVEGSVL